MKRALVTLGMLLALPLAAQEKKAQESLVAVNSKEGVQITAPRTPGKDQHWVAKTKEGKFFKDSAVLVSNKLDEFNVEVNVTRKKDREEFSAPEKIAESARDNFVKDREDGSKASFKEVKIKEETSKAKVPGLGGRTHMHHLVLTDERDGKHEIIEYFVISSDVLYRITISFTEATYKKYFPREGQAILASIKKCKVER